MRVSNGCLPRGRDFRGSRPPPPAPPGSRGSLPAVLLVVHPVPQHLECVGGVHVDEIFIDGSEQEPATAGSHPRSQSGTTVLIARAVQLAHPPAFSIARCRRL